MLRSSRSAGKKIHAIGLESDVRYGCNRRHRKMHRAAPKNIIRDESLLAQILTEPYQIRMDQLNETRDR